MIGDLQQSRMAVEVPTAAIGDSSTVCVACGCHKWVSVRDGVDIHRPHTGRIVLGRCSNCRHIAQVPPPTKEQLSEAYAVAYAPYRSAWKQAGWPVWKILREITTWRRMWRLRHVAKGKKLLEVGSGAGDFLLAAHRAGWSVCGVEYSKECAEELNRETGIDLRSGELLPGLWDSCAFDVVALWNVVEHLSDPIGTLKLAADYLKPGGVVFIQVPTTDCVAMGKQFDSQWELLDLPRHLNFFSRDSLAALCGQAGMELVRFRTSAVDVAWCYLASVRNFASGSNGSAARVVKLVSGTLAVFFLFPWMAVRAWSGHGTEAFAVAVKR